MLVGVRVFLCDVACWCGLFVCCLFLCACVCSYWLSVCVSVCLCVCVIVCVCVCVCVLVLLCWRVGVLVRWLVLL